MQNQDTKLIVALRRVHMEAAGIEPAGSIAERSVS
jgi:hypothetical protein